MSGQTFKDLLSQLVAMPTVSSNQQANNDALDYLQRFFEQYGLFCARHTFNGYGALVATTKKGTKAPKVLLAAHVDVVPGPKKLFKLREDNENYYGRGVFDMKLAIAAYMEVVEALGTRIQQYDLGIMITTDEENGGLDGTARLVRLGYKPEVCILPDGSKDWQIETFAKGFISAKIIVEGTAAHGSMPWKGESAIFRLVDLLHDLKAAFTAQTFNTKTLNIATVAGGTAKNQLPAHAEALVDIRFMTNEERQQIVEFINQLCQRHNATYAEEKLQGHPCLNKLTHPLITPFAESIAAITGTSATSTVSLGASDARFFAGVDVPCIITRPAGGGQHADDEWVNKHGAEQYSNIILDYLDKIAR